MLWACRSAIFLDRENADPPGLKMEYPIQLTWLTLSVLVSPTCTGVTSNKKATVGAKMWKCHCAGSIQSQGILNPVASIPTLVSSMSWTLSSIHFVFFLLWPSAGPTRFKAPSQKPCTCKIQLKGMFTVLKYSLLKCSKVDTQVNYRYSKCTKSTIYHWILFRVVTHWMCSRILLPKAPLHRMALTQP